ncbi:MAG: pyridoxamine 5'-phosphate oxidase family protein [Acidobacteria bacterium]|nr:pyridoxamine 5'-phosphate oxidase family protein [Acidobacteriota bacterium]MBI3655791.1 pyridoxamine 5'-phosphate oxidase family protein [Acidobacteriota bacterium]
MSKLVGAELPEELFLKLNGADLEAGAGKVILLSTPDAAGWPHMAMLSYFEVVAKDRCNIRLATYKNSTTTNNMRQTGKLTLSIIDIGMAYYVKGRVREIKAEMEGARHNSMWNMEVEQVLSDHADEQMEATAYIAAGVTYSSLDWPADLLRGKVVLKELLE